MTDFTEKHFSIDPGNGKKMDGCPYSIYEDGHDVKDYIIPPKGYLFVGFKFDPDAKNQIYDGKLIAEYAKESINERLKSNLWKAMLALAIIAVITLIVLLAANVFKTPKSTKPAVKDTKTEAKALPIDTIEKIVVTETENLSETSETTITDAAEPAQTTEVETQQEEPSQPTSTDPSIQFKQDFWNLIHQRTIMMDPYHELFINNKTLPKGEEFDYLRYTILRNSDAFKEWTTRLKKIPKAELESITTVNELVNKLNEH